MLSMYKINIKFGLHKVYTSYPKESLSSCGVLQSAVIMAVMFCSRGVYISVVVIFQ